MWLIIAVSAYFINAGVYIADKFLLSKRIHSSVVYAFFVGFWSIFNFILLPFDFWLPNRTEFIIDISAGVLFLITLVLWYKALHQSEATRVVPIVGALVPVFSLFLGGVFLGEILSEKELLAFFVLIAGGILISIKRTKVHFWEEIWGRTRNTFGKVFGEVHARHQPTRRLLANSFLSAFFFAAYYVLIKHIYASQPFIGGFVWSRLGTFLGVLFLFFVPHWRGMIREHWEDANAPKSLTLFLLVRIMAAVAFIMLNWAISLGNVAMINSLQGAQFLFLILMVLIFSHRYPHILKEELGGGVLAQKIIGVMLVGTGMYLLLL